MAVTFRDAGNAFASWFDRRFRSVAWPIGRGPRILRAPIEIRYPNAGGELTATPTLELPSGQRIPAQNGGWWFGKEMGGGDFEPKFSPFYRWRKFFPKMLFLPPEAPIAPDPIVYDVATRPFSYKSPPFDGPAQIPEGPTY